ncbi:MAG: hypothetical protein K0R54_720 [Clostridiaceae bacterium]|jgi:hypothetical protein|nr:hypothetical protein [Clostridiaceae bacterium]
MKSIVEKFKKKSTQSKTNNEESVRHFSMKELEELEYIMECKEDGFIVPEKPEKKSLFSKIRTLFN